MAPDASSSRAGLRLQRRRRLTRRGELRAAVRDGKRLRTSNLDLRVVLATGAVSRIGFVIPKHGHSSVDRNRLKRRLRELGRVQLVDATPAPVDIVMRAMPGAYRAAYDELRAEVEVLRARLSKLSFDLRGESRAGEAPESPRT